jgi:hypothetical protein
VRQPDDTAMAFHASSHVMPDGQGTATQPDRGTGFRFLERPTGAMRVVYEVIRVLLVVAAVAGAAQPLMSRAGLPTPFDITLR